MSSLHLVSRHGRVRVAVVTAVSLLASGGAAAVQAGELKLDHAQVENIVQRSYQYVGMWATRSTASTATWK